MKIFPASVIVMPAGGLSNSLTSSRPFSCEERECGLIGMNLRSLKQQSYYYGMSVVRQLPKVFEHARDLRKRLTDAEKVLWNILRDRKFLGYKFRRQAPVGEFIADFLCNNPPLIIEVDGPIHIGQTAQDAERTEGIFADYEIPCIAINERKYWRICHSL